MANRSSAGWSSNSNNPNLTPLPARPSRPGIGVGGGAAQLPGPPPQFMSPGGPSNHNGQHPQHALPAAPAWNQGMGGPPGPPPTGPGSSTPGPPPVAVPLGAPEPATTLFVGSIAAGVTDVWVTRLLEACGSLRQLKRPNKAFAFAEFHDPGSVKRALKTLSGLELPAFQSGEPAKKLMVKADEKTKNYMEGWENERILTDQDEINDSEAISRVQSIVNRMNDPSARNEGAETSTPSYEISAHLKDLTSEDLPEEHRGSVLNEIEQFRQAAAAREEAARKKEFELEKQRAREREERERRSGPNGSSSSGPSGSRGHGRFGPGADPQSYNRPLGFVSERVKQEGAAAEDLSNLDPEERDEIEERRRKKQKEADDERTFRDAEHRAVGRERARIAHWERELAKEKSDAERRLRDKESMLRFYQSWTEEEAQEKEMFYYDRSRWRHHRLNLRRREQEKDTRDEEAEAAAAVAAAAEAERFLAQQAAEMAALQERQRAAGILIPGSGTGAIRLNIATKKDGSGGGTGAGAGVGANAAGGGGGGGGMRISIGLKKDGIGASLAAGGAGAGPAAVGGGDSKQVPLVRHSVLGDADDDDGLRKRKLRKIVLDDDEGAPQSKRR
ncbi:unnamed protein product [Tilletia controversa]|uniref:RRM domain-containing protein n=1 Tax=Tilletia controversa TaxID=13291 RepID=A0A8X7MTI8_9BASI|nr:hypothetical protein CF328_g4081 [Tilletia controversa]KAE8247324.1 hypothetical protein A4X06_0g4538 [Tilletia controversa]CAD6919460.1 unnamed protein product [Tilletia controversa]CAD6924141.1 unnamed protein product [Tilletia controversa]CAD6924260.1 unnamed protein product [Tilletia controversa]